MIILKIKLVPPTKQMLRGLKKRLTDGIRYGLHNSRAQTISSIREFTPVVTGNLQRSITSSRVTKQAESFRTRFFSRLDYSTIIDEGLQGYKKRDYLNRGINQEMPHIINRIEMSMIKEWNK